MFFKNQRIGKFEILSTIGSGGFGSVYLAKDVLIDKKVAIKVPHKQGDDVEKLLKEPRLLAALNHPNIVSVITAERVNGIFYIVMEYIDGATLEHHLRNHKMLTIDQALAWFIKIAEALTYAHQKNIIHRDIRPANILISNDGLLKVGDLGTSRYLLEKAASTRIGSPPYMAPEHFQGKATYQSDIYSMGILMYESLTGRLPFYDKNPQRLAKMVYEGGAAPPHQHNDQVSQSFSRLISRAMHKNLALRYASAKQLLADLINEKRAEAVQTNLVSHQEHSRNSPSEPRFGKHQPFFPKDLHSREISSLFCWNCSRPIQKRALACPHCNVTLK